MEKDWLDALLAEKPENVTGGTLASPDAEPPPEVHDTAMTVDKFARRRAEAILDRDMAEADPDVQFNNLPSMADAYSSCFEPYPRLREAEETSATVRREWFKQLLSTPEFKSLHNQTVCSAAMSELGAKTLLREWEQYEENYDPPPPDEDGGPGEESIGQTVGRIRSTQKAAKQAQQDVGDAKDACSAFGLEVGDDAGTDPQEVMRLFRKLKNDPTLRLISENAGRFIRLAASLQRSKPVHGMDDMVGVTLDDDLSRLLVNELAALCLPDLETDTLRRLVEKQTMCREYKAMESLGRGPIMILVDESSSMRGEKIAQAKGFALALAWLAQHQSRWICLVGWSSEGQVRHVTFPPGKVDQIQLMEWCSQQFMGGTSPPLATVEELFTVTGAPEGKTDVIWVTDGECRLNGADEFNAFREREKLKVWTVAVGTTGHSFEPVSDIVASVDSLSTGTDIVREVLSI